MAKPPNPDDPLADLRSSIAELSDAIDSGAYRDDRQLDEWQSALDELRADLRHAEREIERANTPRQRPERVHPAIGLARMLADGPIDPEQARYQSAITRATAEAGRVVSDAKRERERFAFSLYSELRADPEIIAALCEAYEVSEGTARADLERVRAIAASWRDTSEWHRRRDQHVMALRKLYDHAMSLTCEGLPTPDIDQARKIMAQIATVEGFNAPTRGVVLHGHGLIPGQGDSTLPPDGPGIVAGVDIRTLTRGERDALLLLLPADQALALPSPVAREASQVARGEVIEAYAHEERGIEAQDPSAAHDRGQGEASGE